MQWMCRQEMKHLCVAKHQNIHLYYRTGDQTTYPTIWNSEGTPAFSEEWGPSFLPWCLWDKSSKEHQVMRNSWHLKILIRKPCWFVMLYGLHMMKTHYMTGMLTMWQNQYLPFYVSENTVPSLASTSWIHSYKVTCVWTCPKNNRDLQWLKLFHMQSDLQVQPHVCVFFLARHTKSTCF